MTVIASTPSAPPAASGGWIAFVSERDGTEELYIMNTDGSDQRRLTENDAADRVPAWQP